MHKCDMERHFMGRRRRLGLVVPVAEQGHEEQGSPEDEVGHGDDDEHLDPGQPFTFHLGQVRFDTLRIW